MGIDLASKPANTAVCILGWRDRQAEVITLCRGQADHKTKLHTKWLSTTAYGSRGDYGGPITKVGIDAPFGWPEPFLDAVVAYRKVHLGRPGSATTSRIAGCGGPTSLSRSVPTSGLFP